jgi:predicted Rossmann fold nucleotide-binding protein DprA/Smf involved in DNA uptake
VAEAKQTSEPLTDEEAMIMDTLEAEAVHIDDLARKLDLDIGRLSGTSAST